MSIKFHNRPLSTATRLHSAPGRGSDRTLLRQQTPSRSCAISFRRNVAPVAGFPPQQADCSTSAVRDPGLPQPPSPNVRGHSNFTSRQSALAARLPGRAMISRVVVLLAIAVSQVFLGMAAYMSRIATVDAPQPMAVMVGFTVAHVAVGALDRPLADLGLRRRVALSVPFFVPAVAAVAGSDLVVTLPRKLAKAVARCQTSGCRSDSFLRTHSSKTNRRRLAVSRLRVE